MNQESPISTEAAPAISCVSAESERPLWSVMIPTFNCAKYLRQTLESVLTQDRGAAQMQIEVVDDCSTRDDPESVVREIGRGRVAFFRKSRNEGAVANFNTCLQRSRGQLVHILHGDDFVLPSFYARVEEMSACHPDVAAFFVRCKIVEENGDLDTFSGRIRQLAKPSTSPGTLLYDNQLMTPGVVVRRSFYEAHGGFIAAVGHVADWEMWMRAIRLGGGLWRNEILAAYRLFSGNDTGRLARSAQNLRDCLLLGKLFESTFSEFELAHFRILIAKRARKQQKIFSAAGDREAALANEQLWRELTPRILRWGISLRNRILPPA